MQLETGQTSLRERGKADRRRRIVDAARAIIRETGETGLSMRALAERAQVSVTTPYNLLGSKGRVLEQLVDEDFKIFLKAFEKSRPESGLDQIFEVVVLSCKYYREEPAYHRAVMGEMYLPNSDTASLFGGDRLKLWRDVIATASEQGDIRNDIDLETLRGCLNLHFTSVLLAWIRQHIDVDELESRICYGFALLLLGAATDQAREPLSAELQWRQTEIDRHQKRRRRR